MLKDGAVLRVCSIVCVTIAYASYMAFSFWCTNEVPDGLLFGTVMLVLGALAGVDLEKAIKERKLKEF